MKKSAITLMLAASLLAAPPSVYSDGDFKDIVGEYLEFATYSDGVISIKQLYDIGLENVVLINTSSEDGYEKSHIPGSTHIDWREVLEKSDAIPRHGLVVVYCKNSLVSAKAQLLLSLAGYENVKVLAQGYSGWREYQAAHMSANSGYRKKLEP